MWAVLAIELACVTCGPGTEKVDGQCVPVEEGGPTDSAGDSADSDTDPPEPGGWEGSTTLPGEAIVLSGQRAQDATGYRLVVRDFDGDGQDDLAVGAVGFDEGSDYTGRISVVFGPITQDGLVRDADVHVTGATTHERFGYELVAVGDLLVVGDDGPINSSDYDVWPLQVGASGSIDELSSALVREGGEADEAGRSLSGSEDLTGDGVADLIVGAWKSSQGDNYAGAVYVFSAPEAGQTYASAEARILGRNVNSYNLQLGSQVSSLGDVNGDGVADLAAGESGYFREGVGYPGRIAVFLGPVDGTMLSDDADGLIEGVSTNYNFHERDTLARPGDVDGDGLDDLAAVDYYQRDSTGEHLGILHIVPGGEVETMTSLLTSPWQLHSESEYAGWRLAELGEATGDEADDLLLGVPATDFAGTSSGAAYLVPGGQSGSGSVGDYAQASWYGDGYGWSAGSGLAAGDLDGDGVLDLVLAAPFANGEVESAGAVFILPGG